MTKKSYPCTVVACDKVFSKSYELKKHLALHKDPKSVFFCPECNFITLQKKNLAIHVATHTGERPHHCPHVVVVDANAGTYEERCAFRTNDPAALTKHRKKVHAYIPHRGRKATPVPFSKWKESARRLLAPYQPPPSPAPPKSLSRSSSASDVGSSTACTSASVDASDGRTLQPSKAHADPVPSADMCAIQSWLESTDVYGHPMQANAPGNTPTRHPWSEDPGPSTQTGPSDVLEDHARHVWAETDALMRSMSGDSFDAPAPHPWVKTGAYPQAPPAASLDMGNGHSWAKTDALMRSASLDLLDPSAPHPWAEPDVGVQTTTAGTLDAFANDRSVPHSWAKPNVCLPSTSSNVFGNNALLHPWAETRAHKQPTPTLHLSGNNPTLHSWPGNPGAHVQSAPAASFAPHTLPPPGNADAFDPMYNAYILTSAASVAPKHGMDLNNLYDPTLCADWMAAYEYNYTNADSTRVTHVTDPVDWSVTVPGARTGREGCICSEWMNEAGVEGWDQGVVHAHKEFHAF